MKPIGTINRSCRRNTHLEIGKNRGKLRFQGASLEGIALGLPVQATSQSQFEG
jgi:hypothetical protein